MNYITYSEAASIHNVSVLTICKAVQDNQIPIHAKRGRLYLDADELRKYKIIPLRDAINETHRRRT